MDMNLAKRMVIGVLAALALQAPSLAAPVNAAAPAFSLDSMSGRTVDLAQYKGNVVMINFWATWCGPCRQEMPLLEQLHKKYKPMGFTLLGINVEPDSRGAVEWLKSTPVSFPILFDTDSKVSRLYAVAGMPSTVIVDRKGNLRWLHRGYKAGDENQYLDQIRALIRE
jgi:thiol-disulfide isomerase/thioredoxin